MLSLLDIAVKNAKLNERDGSCDHSSASGSNTSTYMMREMGLRSHFTYLPAHKVRSACYGYLLKYNSTSLKTEENH